MAVESKDVRECTVLYLKTVEQYTTFRLTERSDDWMKTLPCENKAEIAQRTDLAGFNRWSFLHIAFIMNAKLGLTDCRCRSFLYQNHLKL